MKARVKATGKIIEVSQGIYSPYQYVGDNGAIYTDEDIEILQEVLDSTPDYWTRLEHQYARMAMQGMLNNSYLAGEFRKDPNNGIEDMSKIITKAAAVYAHALVEKMKEEK